MVRSCPQCGQDFEQKTSRGRPRTYCTDRCRRLGYEHRRAAEQTGEPVRVVRPPAATKVVERVVKRTPTLGEIAAAVETDPDAAVQVVVRLADLIRTRKLSDAHRQQLARPVEAVVKWLLQERTWGQPWRAAHWVDKGTFTPEQWATLIAAAGQVEQDRGNVDRAMRDVEQQQAGQAEVAQMRRTLRDQAEQIAALQQALYRRPAPQVAPTPDKSAFGRLRGA